MKQFFLLVYLLSSQIVLSQTQIDFDGFDDIRLGMTIKEIKKITKEIDNAPTYALFQPSSDEELRDRYGEYADAQIQRRDEEIETFSELNLVKRWCLPKSASDQHFFNLSIECIECVFSEGVLIRITVVLDKKDISFESKEILKMDLVERIVGEPFCRGAANYVPQPSECSWYSDEDNREIFYTDASEREGAPGESVNVVFGRLF